MENDFGFVPLDEKDIPQAQPLENPFAEGGGVPISETEAVYQEERQKYETPKAELLAGAAGVARGISFGLSDLLLKGLGYSEEAAKLQAYQPSISTAGEVAGTVGGVFFGPGALLVKGAVKATAPIASNLGRVAAKEAIEGGVYGIGQTISEQALGSKESVAESLVANVGLGTILGAGFGIGAHGLGEGAQALKRQTSKFLKGEDALTKWLGTADDYVSEEFRKEAINIDELKAIAKEQGISLTKGMLSDSELIRGLESSLAQRPTVFGRMAREEIKPTYQAFQKQAAKVVEEASQDTVNSIGDEIKNTLINRAHQLYDPASSLYQEIGQATKNIQITPELRGKLVKTIDQWSLGNTLARSDARKAAQDAIANLSEDIFMPLDKVKDIASDLGGKMSVLKRAGDSKQAMLIGQLKTKIDNFYDRQVRRAAIDQALEMPDGKQIANELLADIKEAKKGWREFKTFLADVGDEAGLGKINSFSQFMDKIESIDNEKLARNLFDPKSVKSLKFVQENFPDVFDKLRRIEIAKLSAKADGVDPLGNVVTDIGKLTREVKKYSPEALELILGKDKVRSLNNLEKLYKKMPRKIGPSGTPEGMAYLNFLKPMMWVGDAAAFSAYKTGNIVLEMQDKQTKSMIDQIKKIVTNVKKPIVGASTVAITGMTRDYEQRLKDIQETALNPEKYSMAIQENTKGLAAVDPDLQQSIANTSMEAADFLSTKAPKNPFEGSMISGKIKWKPSDSELSKFNRYLKAIDDPFSVLIDLEQDLLTQEAVEAVKTIYPNLYAKMSEKLIEQIAEDGQEMPFVKQLQVSLFLGQPITGIQDIQMMQRLQSGAQAAGQMEQAQQQAPKKTRKIEGDFLKGKMGQSEQLIRSRGE